MIFKIGDRVIIYQVKYIDPHGEESIFNNIKGVITGYSIVYKKPVYVIKLKDFAIKIKYTRRLGDEIVLDKEWYRDEKLNTILK